MIKISKIRLLVIVACTLVAGCVAKSSYVDQLAKVAFVNAKEIAKISPSKETIINEAMAWKLAEESSALVSPQMVSTFASVGTSIGLGGGAMALISSIAAIYLKRKVGRYMEAGHKAALEPDPDKAKEHLEKA